MADIYLHFLCALYGTEADLAAAGKARLEFAGDGVHDQYAAIGLAQKGDATIMQASEE